MVRSAATLTAFLVLVLRSVVRTVSMGASMGEGEWHDLESVSRVFHGGVVRIDRREIRLLTVA